MALAVAAPGRPPSRDAVAGALALRVALDVGVREKWAEGRGESDAPSREAVAGAEAVGVKEDWGVSVGSRGDEVGVSVGLADALEDPVSVDRPGSVVGVKKSVGRGVAEGVRVPCSTPLLPVGCRAEGEAKATEAVGLALPAGALGEGVGRRVGGGERELVAEARGVDVAVPAAYSGVPVPGVAGEALAAAAREALPAAEGVPPKEAEAGAGEGVSKGPGDAVAGAEGGALGVAPCTVLVREAEWVRLGVPVALPVAVEVSAAVGCAVRLPTAPAAPAEVRVVSALAALEAEPAPLAVAARGREAVPVVVTDGEAVECLLGERVEEAVGGGDGVAGVSVAVGAALEAVNACVGEAGVEAEAAEEKVRRMEAVGREDCVAGKGEGVDEAVAAPPPSPPPPLPGVPVPHSLVEEGLKEDENPLGVGVLAAPREAEAESEGVEVRVGRVLEDAGDTLAPAGGEAVKRNEGVSLGRAGLKEGAEEGLARRGREADAVAVPAKDVAAGVAEEVPLPLGMAVGVGRAGVAQGVGVGAKGVAVPPPPPSGEPVGLGEGGCTAVEEGEGEARATVAVGVPPTPPLVPVGDKDRVGGGVLVVLSVDAGEGVAPPVAVPGSVPAAVAVGARGEGVGASGVAVPPPPSPPNVLVGVPVTRAVWRALAVPTPDAVRVPEEEAEPVARKVALEVLETSAGVALAGAVPPLLGV